MLSHLLTALCSLVSSWKCSHNLKIVKKIVASLFRSGTVELGMQRIHLHPQILKGNIAKPLPSKDLVAFTYILIYDTTHVCAPLPQFCRTSAVPVDKYVRYLNLGSISFAALNHFQTRISKYLVIVLFLLLEETFQEVLFIT